MDMKDGAQTTACLQHALDRGPAPAFRPPTGSMLPTQPCPRHTQPLTLQQVSCWTLTKDAILQVMEVSVCGPRYWQHSVSGAAEAGNPLAACYSAGALHVQRRAGVLSYADDPSGIRSLLSKAFRRVSLGGLCRSSLWAPAPHRGRGPCLPPLSCRAWRAGACAQLHGRQSWDLQPAVQSLMLCDSFTGRCLTDCSMPHPGQCWWVARLRGGATFCAQQSLKVSCLP